MLARTWIQDTRIRRLPIVGKRNDDRAADKAIARLAAALVHPLRVRILVALASGPNNAASLAREFGDVDTSSVYYHLGVLDDNRVVEAVRSRKVRGGRETKFRLRPESSWIKLWEIVPLPVMTGFRNAWFREFVDLAIAALKSGALDNRAETIFTATPLAVDRQGLSEVNEAITAAIRVIQRVATESRERLAKGSADEEVNLIVAAAAFEAPQRGGGLEGGGLDA